MSRRRLLVLALLATLVLVPRSQAQGTSHTFNALLTDYKEGSKIGDAVSFDCTLLVTGVDSIAQL